MAVDDREWVSLETCAEQDGDGFWEAGGIYAAEDVRHYTRRSRELEPGEHVVACPRCGQRFAAAEESTAEACRDRHFDGDEDMPSVCRDWPARPPQLLRLVRRVSKGVDATDGKTKTEDDES